MAIEIDEPEIAEELLQSHGGIEEPLPDEPCDDQGNGQGIEIDGAEDPLPRALSVQKDSQDEPQDEAAETASHVDQEVLQGEGPQVVLEQPRVLPEADEMHVGEDLAGGHGHDPATTPMTAELNPRIVAWKSYSNVVNGGRENWQKGYPSVPTMEISCCIRTSISEMALMRVALSSGPRTTYARVWYPNAAAFSMTLEIMKSASTSSEKCLARKNEPGDFNAVDPSPPRGR
jgi:hypothetical protein